MTLPNPRESAPTEADSRPSAEPSCASCGHDDWFWADQKVWARVVVKRNPYALGNPYDVFRDPDDDPQPEEEDLLVDLRCPACNRTIRDEIRVGELDAGLLGGPENGAGAEAIVVPNLQTGRGSP